MALLGKGRFKATVESCGLTRKGKNNLLCFSGYFKGDEWKNDAGEYEPIEDGYGLIGDVWLEKKPESGGGLSEDNIKRLAHVFEWDGKFDTLQVAATGAKCKITIEDETYQGKTRPKLQWLNHINDGDGGGADIKHDGDVAAQAARQYGSAIRAILGTTSSKPASSPRPTVSTTPPSNSALAQKLHAASGATADSVWEAFEKKMHADKTPAEHVENAWFDFLQESAGVKETDAVRDWAKVMVAMESYSYLPFP